MARKSSTMVWVKLQFIGFHRWKDAPAQVAYLQQWHRHVFHVRLGVAVTELNRQIEFIQLKDKVQNFVNARYTVRSFEASCEMIANDLQREFDACLVEVSEDNENGATVVSWPDPTSNGTDPSLVGSALTQQIVNDVVQNIVQGIEKVSVTNELPSDHV